MDYPEGEGKCTECTVIFPTLEGSLHLEVTPLDNGGLQLSLVQDDAGYWPGMCGKCLETGYTPFMTSTFADL